MTFTEIDKFGIRQNNLKNGVEIEMRISDGSEDWSGLWCDRIGQFDGAIMLLDSEDVDFDVETLKGYGCFLQQLNHEILHVIIARLEGYDISVQLDDLRDEFPQVSHKNYPFF